MNLTIEKIIGLIILLIILIVLIIFIGIPNTIGIDISLQNKLRQCCSAYVANGCPLFGIDYIEISSIYCDDEFLPDLVKRFNMDATSLRNFCNCPK